jgi:hypothetical protein
MIEGGYNKGKKIFYCDKGDFEKLRVGSTPPRSVPIPSTIVSKPKSLPNTPNLETAIKFPVGWDFWHPNQQWQWRS